MVQLITCCGSKHGYTQVATLVGRGIARNGFGWTMEETWYDPFTPETHAKKGSIRRRQTLLTFGSENFLWMGVSEEHAEHGIPANKDLFKMDVSRYFDT